MLLQKSEAVAGDSLTLNRRGFLVGATLAALVAPLRVNAQGAGQAGGTFEITDWVRIDKSGITTIGISQCEVGQGAFTGLAQILADELGADWSRVRVQFVTGRDAYRIDAANEELQQFVGASMSVTQFGDRMKIAGAQVREALIQAAARRTKIRFTQFEAINGKVVHMGTGKAIDFGDLVEDAAKVQLEHHPRLKPISERKIFGAALKRLDTPEKVDGSAIYGIDVKVPDMLVGVPRFAPSQTGQIVSIRNKEAIEKRPGVRAVVLAPSWPRPAMVCAIVVADTFWQAKTAADALDLETTPGPSGTVQSDKIMEARIAALESGQGGVAANIGDAPGVLADPKAKIVSAEYHVPYIIHATMEPVNAVVHVREGEIEVWGPIQGQDFVRWNLAKSFNIPAEKVIVHTTYLGGSFGRKYVPDFVIQAAFASKAVGKPVKVIRTREDDIRHSYYRPCASARMRAALGPDGYPIAMQTRVAGESLYAMIKAKRYAEAGYDETMVDAIYDLAYTIPNQKVETIDVKLPIPISFLRSVGSTASVFFLESFIDEMAEAAKIDPYTYRRKLLVAEPLGVAVLDKVAEMSGWGKTQPGKGSGRGIAFNLYTGRGGAFKTYVAQVVDVTLDAKGKARVDKVYCAVDAGAAVNPTLISANIEGGIGFGLTNVFKSEITFKNGEVQQGNFDDYPIWTLAEMPKIEVAIMKSDRPPQGCGEAALTPLTAAVARAIVNAGGARPRQMPFKAYA